jgi:hypothetical protein
MKGNPDEESPNEDFKNISLKIKNYMCFSDAQGFDSIKPINIIIGRNNSGKSRMMDMLQLAASPDDLEKNNLNGVPTEILLSLPLAESELKIVFPENSFGGEISGDHWTFGKKYIGKKITISISKKAARNFVELDPPLDLRSIERYEKELADRVRNPFSGKIIKKIAAERDIEPDVLNDNKEVLSNGAGATNIIEIFFK